MARPRQPVELLLIKGKKHLTKSEIEERSTSEIKAKSDKVRAPSYLPPDLKKDFNKIAKELVDIGIMSNLDVDALARYLIARKMWLQVTDELLDRGPIYSYQDERGEMQYESSQTYSDLLINQDKLFKQCRQSASDLGLTIASRCRLVIPKKDDDKPKSDAERRFGDRL